MNVNKNKIIAIVVVVCMISMVLVAIVFDNERDHYGYDYKGPVTSYLHEIEFDKYTDDPSMDYVKEEIKEHSGGCSSVRNGNYIGRNFDYFYNFVPTFVIKTNAAEGRFASIGVGQHWGINEKDLLAGKCKNDLKYLPNLTLDGVNENGVYINDNVVRIDPNHKVTTGTNPDAEKTVHFLYIPRFVLDHAKTADHAIELIKSVNIVGSLKDKYYLHFMVADKDKTFIVEAYDNQLFVEERNQLPSGQYDIEKIHEKVPIMSNFYNLAPINDDTHPLGLERYKILYENYDMGSTFDGMFYLMQQVKFSNLVLTMEDKSWFSDTEKFTFAELKDIYSKNPDDYDKLMKEWNEYMWVYCQHYKDVMNNDRREIGKDWITIHNSTYDLENKVLEIIVDEDYLHRYTYSL